MKRNIGFIAEHTKHTELQQLSLEIGKLYTDLKTYESDEALTEALSNKVDVGALRSRVVGLLEKLEGEFSIIAFPPEVSAETQRMFFAMNKLVHGYEQ